MKRLLNTEFYKLRKSLCLKTACLGAVFYALAEILAAAPAKDICGYTALTSAFLNWEIPYLFCGIFAAFYISGDIEGGGLAEEITGGFGRGKIFAAKTVVFLFGSGIILFCYQFFPTFIFSCMNGFTNQKTQPLFPSLLYMEGTYLTLVFACLGSCILFSFLFCKTAASIVSEVAYIMIFIQIFMNAARRMEPVSRIYQIFPYYKFQLIAENLLKNSRWENGLLLPPQTAGMLGHINGMGMVAFCAGISFLLPVLAGYFIFRHSMFK